MSKNKESKIFGPAPFGGLVPDTVKGRVLAEIVADPFSEYTPSSMADLTMHNSNRVSEALREYEVLGLLKNMSRDKRRPVFRPVVSKRLNALMFLSLAVNDDVLGENCMDRAVVDYIERIGYQVYSSAQTMAVTRLTRPDGSDRFICQRCGRSPTKGGGGDIMSDEKVNAPPIEAILENYKYDLSKLKVKIDGEHYSNMAYMLVSGRDVYVDFLKMPGVIIDGVPVASGVRVYMPIAAAQRLADALITTIKQAEKAGGIEPIHTP